MSVRIRAFLIIILINLGIILFSVFAGVNSVRAGMEESIETDLAVVADIADHFISSEIANLKLKASELARNMAERTTRAGWSGFLTEERDLYPDFIGMAVYNSGGGLLASSGEMPAPPEIITDSNISQAFSGERILSTTHPSSGGVVFYLAVPVSGHEGTILVITLPGMYFSQRLSTFTIWETGHIFIDDAEGYILANPRQDWVENRLNFIHMAETDSRYTDVAAVIKQMVQGETGVGRFSIAGIPRVCAFRPIGGSAAGWCLGVIAPLPESPIQNIDTGLLVVGLVSFSLGVIAAAIASSFIKKPFEEVAALKEAAEANSNSKSHFLATMSHEMRTPLNAVIGLSQLTLDGKIDGEERENTEKVYTAGLTLLSIINDILDISKIESGKFDLNPIEYDVPSLINDAVMFNTMRIGEKPITFKLVIDESFPSKLLGDDLRVKQIFNNLLSNAFKYTKAGTVELRISWERCGGDVWFIASVIDSGIGIKKEDLGKLFQNYTQVDTGSNRKIEGTGLGLALTKHMVELMEGSIGVESEYGKGSVFTFRIKQGFVSYEPIGLTVADNLRTFRYSEQKQEQHSKFIRVRIPYARVLIVDDLEPNLAVVRGIMKPYGMKVDCVTSGEEALRLIGDGIKYDAIFMDHMMPGMNGIEATHAIRALGTEYAANVPVIALTANAIRGNEEMFLESGFQAFLSKPIDIAQMDAVIRQWVRDKSREKEIPPPADFAAAQNKDGGKNEIDGIDLGMILEQLGGDEESLGEVLKIYVEQLPAVLERVKAAVPELASAAGQEGTGREVPASFREKLDEYIIDIHGIKGSCRNMYAGEVSAMAEALEHAGKAGDLSFIQENNAALVGAVEKLITSIKKWLESK